MANRKLIVEVVADPSQFRKGMSESSAAAATFEGKIKGVSSSVHSHLMLMGGALLGAGSLVEGLKKSVGAAVEFSQASSQMSAQLKQNGENASRYTSQIAVMNGQMERLGFTNAQSEEAFSRLDRASGNASSALKYMGVTADLAAVKHISLSQAALVVGKVIQGTTTAMNRYGIVIPKGTSATEALRIAQQKMAGQAAAMAKPTERFSALLTDFEAKIGQKLLPTIDKYVNKLGVWFNNSENQRKVTDAVAKALHALQTVLAIVVPLVEKAWSAGKKLVDMLGGLKNALIALAALKVAVMISGWGAAVTKTGGAVAGLRASLLGLAKMGPIAVVIALSLVKKSSLGQQELDKLGLGFLGKLPLIGGALTQTEAAGYKIGQSLFPASSPGASQAGVQGAYAGMTFATAKKMNPALTQAQYNQAKAVGTSTASIGVATGQASILSQLKAQGWQPDQLAQVQRLMNYEDASGKPGDHNTSFGPRQLHAGGQLPASVMAKGAAYAQQWAWSPAGLKYAAQGIAGFGNLHGATLAQALANKQGSSNIAKEAAATFGGSLPGDAAAAAAADKAATAADKAATAAEKKKAAAAKKAAAEAFASWKTNYFTPLDNQYKSDMLITDASKQLNKLKALHAKLAIDLKAIDAKEKTAPPSMLPALKKEHQALLSEEQKVQGKIQAIQKKFNDAKIAQAKAAAAVIQKQFDRVLSLDVSHILRNFDRAFATQMSAFDKATAAGLTALASTTIAPTVQTPEEKALADFLAGRSAVADAAAAAQRQTDLAAAISGGDPVQIAAAQDAINNAALDTQQAGLQTAADASRVAADKATADAQTAADANAAAAQQAYQDQRDLQKQGLQDINDDQKLALQQHLDDLGNSLTAHTIKWSDYLAALAAMGIGTSGLIPPDTGGGVTLPGGINVPSGVIGGGFGGSFAAGGIAPGRLGQPMLAVIHGGERVQTPAQQRGGAGGAGGNIYINVTGWVGNDQQLAQKFRNEMAKLQKRGANLGFA